MIKTRKSILFCFIVVCSFFFSITRVSANSIDKIEMDVYLDQDGDATVVEVWKASLSQGTEGYRPYTGLGNSSISNFSVSDESNRVYDSLLHWDTKASFDDKAYKSGIHSIENGVELCWGISSYGSRTYTLKYNISDFVTQYTDTQGIYFDFLHLDQNVGKAKITIHSDIPFSLENAKIWAFGNNGSINFEDGNIVLDSDGLLSSDQYMVALVRFESNLFNAIDKSNNSFDSIYDSAFSGVTDSKHKSTDGGILGNISNLSLSNGFMSLIKSLFSFLLSPIIIIVIFLIIFKSRDNRQLKRSGKSFGQLNFGEEGRTLPDDGQINYWRDIPCDKDLERAYWLCSQYNIVPEKVLNQGIVGAILLKWIKNGYITINKTKNGLFSIKDNNYAIDFTNMTRADNEIERGLFGMFLAAADSNKVLEAEEFSKWIKRNYHQITSWFSSIIYKEQMYLEENKLIDKVVQKNTGTFGKTENIIVRNVDPQLREEAIQIMGLKKFLLDFSRMPEKNHYEVHVWEEYLIFAQLLGIADKVEEQFSKLYPNFNQETVLNKEISAAAARNIAGICYEGFVIGVKSAAAQSSSRSGRNYSGSDRFSGGGGSSFSGGGISSGGSSGGGFR